MFQQAHHYCKLLPSAALFDYFNFDLHSQNLADLQ
jgi:hypothetical protein